MYSIASDETAHGIIADLAITYEQLRFVREKLERFGLLQSKNEEIHDDNLEKIVKYLQDVEKKRKKADPKTLNYPG